MKLLYTKRSPYARKVRIVALEKKITLELLEEDLINKSERLTTSNPLGKIPTLIFDHEETLCDSPVICAYLDNLKESPRLIPQDPQERLRVLHLEAIADGIMDALIAAYMEKNRHPGDFHAQFVQTQEDSIHRALKYFDKHIAELKNLSLASIAVACAMGYANFRLPHLIKKESYPDLIKWYQEFSQRPSLLETRPG